MNDTSSKPIDSSKSSERTFVSPYAPLFPEGPLPPGLTETSVASIYRNQGIHPKRVLLNLKIKDFTEPTTRRLRRAVDKPEYRRIRKSGDKTILPELHNALYSWQRDHSPNVYNRLVKPAEYQKEQRTYLNPAKFRHLIESEKKEGRDFSSPAIAPNSEEEALALFVLAFALLQDSEAYQILEPVLNLGHQFQEFFGVTKTTGEILSKGSQEQAKKENPNKEETEKTESIEEKEKPPEEEGIPDTKIGYTVSPQELKAGAWGAAFAKSQAQHEVARAKRCELGKSLDFDAEAFNDARASECITHEEVRQVTERIKTEIGRIAQGITSGLKSNNIETLIEIPANPYEQAIFLDQEQDNISEILGLLEVLNIKRTHLKQIGVSEEFEWQVVKPSSLKATVEILKQRIESVDKRIDDAQNWQQTLSSIKEMLADCGSPKESRSLQELSLDIVLSLLRRALVDDALEPLAALLLRYLSEKDILNKSEPALELICEILNRAAASGDAEAYQETMAYMPLRILQQLLVCGHEVIGRHVLLTTLRESVARRHPFFFTDIWPYEQGRWDRVGCTGEGIYKLFNCLYILYWRAQSMPSLVQALVSTGPAAKETEERDRRLAIARRQAAEVLASRLETTGNVTGIFYRLRQFTASQFFKPMVPSIRDRRIREVQNQLAKLERKFRRGDLEEEILENLGDDRNLSGAHRRNLHRYIEMTIEAIKDWVKQESDFGVSESISCEDELMEEILTAKKYLHVGEKGDHSGPRIGSIEWLEQGIGTLIGSIRRGEWPESSFAFLGELPSSDALFSSPETDESPIHAAIKWPSWLDPTPSSERSWVCHLHGQLGWKDLLQDGIAKIILGRSRSPVEILESLMRCGEFEAVIEAARFPGFNDAATAPILGRAQDLNSRRGNIEIWLDDIDHRLATISGEELSHDAQLAVQQLQGRVYEVLADIDRLDIDRAHSKAAELRQSLEELEEQIRTADSERRERLKFLKGWLSEARVVLPENANVHEAEHLVKKIRDEQVPRRTHLLQLQRLDAPGVPDRLRTAVRDFIRTEDRPSVLPDKEGAELAGLYIENLVEISQDWWVMLRGLDQVDITYEKIQEIASLFAARLSLEVNAIAKGQAGQAQVLDLLFEGSKWTVSDFYKALREKQLIGKLERLAELELPGQGEELWSQAKTHIETLIAESRISIGTGETVENAYQAFGQGRYGDVCNLARSAWAWARPNKADEVGPLVAIYAWSSYRTYGAAYDRAEIDALGLLLRYQTRIRERAKGIELNDLLGWWTEIVGGNNHQRTDASIGESIVTVLTKLADMPAGAGPRERFGILMKVTDSSIIAPILWSAVRGLKDETVRARSALLLLLFDLGEDGALRQLFGYAGNYSKYLSAFTALAMRTRSDPSAKLHSAISQNLRTLQELKDRSFRGFTEKVAQRLQYESARIQLDVQKTLERDKNTQNYILIVSVVPDESDPPLSLKVELLEASDFRCAEGFPVKDVVKETLLFDRQELEYVILPKDPKAAANVILRVVGETASGQSFDKTFPFHVQLGSDQSLPSLGIDELLEIYEGYDARPVSGQAFVGREEELVKLERSVVRSNPGAVILYGARRLGKTSLLYELRLRYCITSRKGSKTLFLVIPTDEFSVGDKPKSFLDRFLKHIRVSVLHDPKNLLFRQFLEERGVSQKQLEIAGWLDESFEDASFLMRLREYLRRLRELVPGRISQIILVLDEFDKLREHYRKGYEADVEELTNQLRRAATEEQDIGLILAGSDLMRSVVGQYRNALYGSAIVISLEGFDEKKDRMAIRHIIAPDALMGRRLFDDAVIDDILRITGGHPLFMRLLACGAAWLNQRQRVTRGTVIETVGKLLRNEILPGYLPDMPNLALQPLQMLRLMEEMDEIFAKLLLLQLARHTTLERPWAMWASFAYDERLLSLRPIETWTRLRDELRGTNLIVMNDQKLWAFQYPILGERLRIDLDIEFERLQTVAAAKLGAET